MQFKFTEETTIAEWLHHWLVRYKIPTIKETTRDDYITTIDQHIIPALGNYTVSEICTDIIQEFFNEQYKSGNLQTGGALSNKSIVNMKNILSSAMQKAVDLDFISKNPVNAVELKRVINPDITVLERCDEKALIEKLEKDRFSGKYDFAIYLGLKLGLRNGEVAALQWNDIDFSGKIIHIRRRVKRVKNLNAAPNEPHTILQIAPPKSKQSARDIPFSGDFEKTLRSYFEHNTVSGKRKSAYIFLSNTGDVADPTTINNYFKRRLKELSIPNNDIHFHCLRHTFATRAIEKNVDIKTLSTLLGHSSVQFTLDRYAHVLTDQKRRTMELILNDDT